MSTFPENLHIIPSYRTKAVITVPGSKSVSNRALPLAAVAQGRSRLHGLLEADDTLVMIDSLRRLGVRVEREGRTVTVDGQGGPFTSTQADLNAGMSGTTLRFLLPLLAAGTGRFRVTGTGRMLERPIEDQLEALRAAGAGATSELGNGCPPVLIEGRGLKGGRLTVSGDLSSQYLSGLLMAAPLASGPVEIEVTGDLQSKPFVDITVNVMEQLGITVDRDGYGRFRTEPGTYRGGDLDIEGDATAAGNFWVAAAITGASVTVSNVGTSSSQGDRALADILGRMGCTVDWTATSCTVTGPGPGRLRGGTFDLNEIPDQALALAVAGMFTAEPLTITNVYNMRIKETDRISAVCRELEKLGAEVEEGRDWLRVTPQEEYRPASIRTYDDHRMAMAFALPGLLLPGIVIEDPGCTAKTYPGYWDDFALLQEEEPATA